MDIELADLFWYLGIGALFFLMMRRGGCCGGHHHKAQKQHSETEIKGE